MQHRVEAIGRSVDIRGHVRRTLLSVSAQTRRVMPAFGRRILRRALGLLPGSVREPAKFELLSVIGRAFARRLDLAKEQTTYINLGCGTSHFPGFVDIDFFGTEAAYGADLRYPLLIDNESADGIFTEHVLEHLSYDEAASVLAECHRVLKPGGRLRIVLPDVSLFIRRYVDRDSAWFKTWEHDVLTPRGRSLATPMMAISFVTQEYGHRSAWDVETVELFLKRAGFSRVQRCRYGHGGDPMLVKDNGAPDRTSVSLYVEAIKL